LFAIGRTNQARFAKMNLARGEQLTRIVPRHAPVPRLNLIDVEYNRLFRLRFPFDESPIIVEQGKIMAGFIAQSFDASHHYDAAPVSRWVQRRPGNSIIL